MCQTLLTFFIWLSLETQLVISSFKKNIVIIIIIVLMWPISSDQYLREQFKRRKDFCLKASESSLHGDLASLDLGCDGTENHGRRVWRSRAVQLTVVRKGRGKGAWCRERETKQKGARGLLLLYPFCLCWGSNPRSHAHQTGILLLNHLLSPSFSWTPCRLSGWCYLHSGLILLPWLITFGNVLIPFHSSLSTAEIISSVLLNTVTLKTKANDHLFEVSGTTVSGKEAGHWGMLDQSDRNE